MCICRLGIVDLGMFVEGFSDLLTENVFNLVFLKILIILFLYLIKVCIQTIILSFKARIFYFSHG